MRDAVGFEALYVAHRRHVVGYCLRRAPRPDAHEAADETFLIAWRRFDEIPEEMERAWLYGVAYKVLGNQRRGELRRRRLGAALALAGAEHHAGPEAHALRSEEQQQLWCAYRRLRADDQEVLRLAVWEELPHDQIGLVLGCEAGAARQRLHRARERLARQLQRLERRPFVLARKHDDD